MQKQSIISKNIVIKIAQILFLLFILFDVNFAQKSNIKSIEYKNQSLRELADEYLGNPDYWETILRFNNLESTSNLEEGMTLEIPTGIVSSTLEKMDEAKSKISDANSNGAKVLTPELISEAEVNLNKVVSLKQLGNWDAAFDTIHDVLKLATESLEQVLLLRESSADAAISFVKGDVEKRKPIEKLWNEAELYSKLYEADRARTLSNSIAEITFIDLSRIRLNENSQALIQHTRIDILKNITETKVKLVKGDAFAYLLKSPKKKFDIDIPGLNVKIKSRSFWVEKERAKTKIANYDGEIELATKDVTVVVKENQGSIIPDGGVPSEPKNLLPAPELLSPENMKKHFEDSMQFHWERVDSAKKYWFELATDISFQQIVYSNKKIKNNNIEVTDISPGVYYWHVCSIDEFGFPGKFSKQNYLMINEDITKPFLIVVSPKNMDVTKSESIVVKGESEAGLKLYINEQLVELGEKGKFTSEVKLNDGLNRIDILSIDESGNRTNIVRTVFYESSDRIQNKITNKNFISNRNLFITNNREFQLTGKTRSLSYIKFYYNKNEVNTYADTNGNYSLKLDRFNESTDLTQIIITPAGYSKTFKYKILLDDKKPTLKITSAIPKFTKDVSVKLEGSIVDEDSLFINSEHIVVIKNKFAKTLNLVEGKNSFDIVAKDIAENIASKSITITKDSVPPELLEHKLVRNSKNKSEYLLSVTATDISGLTKRAIVTISIDGVENDIILKLTNESLYSKIIFVNKSSSIVFIKYILLEDYLGNSKKYTIK
ncbi:MAG: FecR family protein [Melioribacteraceae bacterium]|nr:FecR family protein [Melioribacteraceae bacterium]